MNGTCITCSSDPKGECSQCASLFCGEEACFKEHALVCGLKRLERSDEEQEDQVRKEDFTQWVLDNEITKVQKVITKVPRSYLQTKLCRSPEMCRVLVEYGANVYEYIGNGQVALDEMVKHFNIRDFLEEAEMPIPPIIEKMTKTAKETLAKCDQLRIVKLEAPYRMTVEEFRLFVFYGWFPVISTTYYLDAVELAKILEDIFFRRYSDTTIKFWTGYLPHQIIFDGIRQFKYYTVEGMLERAKSNAYSFPLLLFYHNHVYHQSKRPKNNMALFETVDSQTIFHANLSPHSIPVTRYTEGMSQGLFHGINENNSWCGTF